MCWQPCHVCGNSCTNCRELNQHMATSHKLDWTGIQWADFFFFFKLWSSQQILKGNPRGTSNRRSLLQACCVPYWVFFHRTEQIICRPSRNSDLWAGTHVLTSKSGGEIQEVIKSKMKKSIWKYDKSEEVEWRHLSPRGPESTISRILNCMEEELVQNFKTSHEQTILLKFNFNSRLNERKVCLNWITVDRRPEPGLYL